MLDWNRLLSNHRTGKKGVPHHATPTAGNRSDFESDFDRVLYSAAFRRLARKTQVHPRVENDHVHNRLTHSLEVASVGRTFARHLGKHLERESLLPPNRSIDDLVWIIMSACLAHDIGNPPFGHAGEYAIREWTTDQSGGNFQLSKGICENEVLDWQAFEGNAQSFRICARSDNRNSIGYIRMTFASLGAMVKYPWDSRDPRAKLKSKYCAFATERDLFYSIWKDLGLIVEGNTVRHPMSYLSEAADDICYTILDVEDAVSMRILPYTEACRLFADVAGIEPGPRSLEELRGMAIGQMIEAHWTAFETQADAIFKGRGPSSLSDALDPRCASSIEPIKELSDKIFAEPTKIATELGAYKSLGKITKAIFQAIKELAQKKCFKDVAFSRKRCLELVWGRDYVITNEKEDLCWWLVEARDYVAGLTDNYATQLASNIEGL